MIRRLTLVLLLFCMFAVACAGGGGTQPAAESDDPGIAAEPDAPADSPAAPEAVVQPPISAANSDAPQDPPASSADPAADPAAGTGAAALFSAFNPLQLLHGGGGLGTSAEVDPQLMSALLVAEDLPRGFVSMEKFSLSMPSEVGDIALAATVFSEGDALADELGLMVVSTGLSLPAEALAELGSLSELVGFSEADPAELESMSQEMGVDFATLTLLDASSLGSEAFGMHMEIDFSGFFDVFGAAGDDEASPAGIAMEMYGFQSGETVLMVMVMWQIDSSSNVDALDLAQKMAARAGA